MKERAATRHYNADSDLSIFRPTEVAIAMPFNGRLSFYFINGQSKDLANPRSRCFHVLFYKAFKGISDLSNNSHFARQFCVQGNVRNPKLLISIKLRVNVEQI